MNRVSFANSINFNVPIQQIILEYFDELMSLYDLICECTNFRIDGNVCDSQSISFNMTFENKDTARSIHNTIDNTTICRYSKQFTCNTQHDINSNVLNVRLVG